MRELRIGEDHRPVRDGRAVEDIEQRGNPTRKLHQETFLDLGKLLSPFAPEIRQSGHNHPLQGDRSIATTTASPMVIVTLSGRRITRALR